MELYSLDFFKMSNGMDISVLEVEADSCDGSSGALSGDLQRKGNNMQSFGNRIASLSAV